VNIFSVVSQHVDWLSQRYAVTAKNVANADTPGFKAQKIADFQNALGTFGELPLAQAQGASLSAGDIADRAYSVIDQRNAEVKHSGNDVSIDKEMSEIGDTSRQFATDMNLEKTFQRMYLSSLKG